MGEAVEVYYLKLPSHISEEQVRDGWRYIIVPKRTLEGNNSMSLANTISSRLGTREHIIMLDKYQNPFIVVY